MRIERSLTRAWKFVEWNHVRPVPRRFIGFGMCFEEQTIDADGRGGLRQRLDHGSISARSRAEAARLLHAVRGVEDRPDA